MCTKKETGAFGASPSLLRDQSRNKPSTSCQGFDLLDPSHDSKKLEDLPRVSLMEDEDGNIHLRCVQCVAPPV